MMPTIHAGDRLELSPPISVRVSDVVVFRNDTMLVCHRVTSIDTQGALSTKGDATDGACEVVQPGSVIGVVTGVLREGTLVSLGQRRYTLSAAAQPTSLKSRIRTVVVRSITRSIRVLARWSLFQQMLALLLRWTATVDVLASAPLQFLASHSKVASFRLRMFPHMAQHLAASTGQKPTCYVVRLGPWRLAQYDQTSESFLLRQSLRDTGLERLIRQCFGARDSTPE